MTRHLSSALATRGATRALVLAGALAACSQSTPQEPAAEVQAAETAGRCVYMNPFSQGEECRDYLGSGWTAESATADCAAQKEGTFTKAAACEYESVLGTCAIGAGTEDAYQITFPGDDASSCSAIGTGCEVFAKGEFSPGKLCDGTDPGIGTNGSVYQPPTLTCVEPLAGEPAGESDGLVCTRSSIAGCTEAGRQFTSYSTCEPVFTQRPYWSAPPSDYETPADDPLLTDPAYLGELAWAKEQVEACGCVCCHSEKAAPDGATSNWYIEKGPIWTDSFYPSGLALGAGWVDSTALGAYPPDQNNGFSRDVSGIPSTDAARMVAFFEGELARRGYAKEDFLDATPFGGPLYDQGLYVPESCASGEGVSADGKVVWSGGGARYLYVLASGSANPGVPPNLDLPAGTVWRVDVAPSSSPIKSGIAYGELPAGTSQGFPAEGKPAALVSGTEYYVYALADIGIPITRCLFTYTK